MSLKIKNAVLCDLVRTEESGNQILIGVYSGDILFSTLPAKFSPTFWVQLVLPAEINEVVLEMKIDAPGLKKPRTNELTIHAEHKEKLVSLVITIPPMDIPSQGHLILSLRQKTGQWRKALSKEIVLDASTPPAG